MAVSRSRARNKGLNRVAASRGNARNPMGTFRGGLGSSVGAPGAPAPAATLGRGGAGVPRNQQCPAGQRPARNPDTGQMTCVPGEQSLQETEGLQSREQRAIAQNQTRGPGSPGLRRPKGPGGPGY